MPAFLAFVSGRLGLLLLLLAATALPWFSVPGLRMAGGTATVAGIEPSVTAIFKVLCLAGIAGAWLAMRAVRFRNHAARGLTLLLVALFLFPYFTMVWSGRVAARAGALQNQHESLSWLGGDIYGEQEIKDFEFKNRVAVTDAELPSAPFQMPDLPLHTMQWNRLPEIVEWLGYSDGFCEFVNAGWFAALAGAALSLAALCRMPEGFHFQTGRIACRTAMAALPAAIAGALLPLFAAGWLVSLARNATARGDHAESWKWLARAARVLPAIRENPDYLAQQGVSEAALHRSTPATALRAATLLDSQGFHAQARDEFKTVLSIAPQYSALHREAVRGLLRSSIRLLRSGDAEAAVGTLDCVLEHDPCNIKALYALQLACLRTARFERLPKLVARFDEVYRFFNTDTKAPVVAAACENGALAEYLRGNIGEALALHRVSLGRPR